MLSSAYNFQSISSFEVLEFDSLFSDAHCPLIMKFDIRNTASKQKVEKQHCNNPEVRLWDDSKKESFTSYLDYGEILKIDSSLELMLSGYNLNSNSIDQVVNRIEDLFKNTASSAFGWKKETKHCKLQNTSKKKWFNAECRLARNTYHTRGVRKVRIIV